MRILPALLLSGLFAGIAAAPAAPCSATPDGTDTGATRDVGPDGGRSDRGSGGDAGEKRPPVPARDEPRLTAPPGPAFKGPEERERSGTGGGPGPAEHEVASGIDVSTVSSGSSAAPNMPLGLRDRADRLERRAGRRPLPPPAPPGGSRR